MPTPKNGFQILNLHLTRHVFKKNTLFLNVLLPKYYPENFTQEVRIFSQHILF